MGHPCFGGDARESRFLRYATEWKYKKATGWKYKKATGWKYKKGAGWKYKKGAEWKCKKAAGGRWKERRQSGTCQPPVVWAREILAVEGLLMAWAMAGKAAMISGVFAQTGTSLMT